MGLSMQLQKKEKQRQQYGQQATSKTMRAGESLFARDLTCVGCSCLRAFQREARSLPSDEDDAAGSPAPQAEPLFTRLQCVPPFTKAYLAQALQDTGRELVGTPDDSCRRATRRPLSLFPDKDVRAREIAVPKVDSSRRRRSSSIRLSLARVHQIGHSGRLHGH